MAIRKAFSTGYRSRSDHWMEVWVGVFLLVLTLLTGPAIGDISPELLQKFPGGQINWAVGIVTAHGMHAPTEKDTHGVLDRQKAILAAKVDAQSRLLEMITAIPIDSKQRVSDVLATKVKGAQQLQDLVRGAEVVAQSFGSDGTVRVTLEMTLTGGLLQLVLPESIRQIEPIKTIREAKPEHPLTIPAQPPDDDYYSGLVVDARGIGFKPALVVHIRDEQGQEHFGPALVSREFVVLRGMAQLHVALPTAKTDARVLPRPLVVKGLSTVDGRPAEIVISNSDAEKLQGASEHLSFLRKCMVTIVTDPINGDPSTT